jgi:hypothetical protein
MAITARYTIPVDIEMLFVLEDDIAGRNFKLQPDRLTGCLGWKRRITQHSNKQKVHDQTVCQLQFVFRKHILSIPQQIRFKVVDRRIQAVAGGNKPTSRL